MLVALACAVLRLPSMPFWLLGLPGLFAQEVVVVVLVVVVVVVVVAVAAAVVVVVVVFVMAVVQAAFDVGVV